MAKYMKRVDPKRGTDKEITKRVDPAPSKPSLSMLGGVRLLGGKTSREARGK